MRTNIPELRKRVAKLGRWLANMVARLLARQLSGLESRHLYKLQNGQQMERDGQHTVAR